MSKLSLRGIGKRFGTVAAVGFKAIGRDFMVRSS